MAEPRSLIGKNDRQKVANQSRDFSRPHSIEYSTVKKAEARIVRMQTKINWKVHKLHGHLFKVNNIYSINLHKIFIRSIEPLQEQWKQYTYQTIRCRPTSMVRRSLLLFLGNHPGFGRCGLVRVFFGVLGSLVEVQDIPHTVLELIHTVSFGVVPERGTTTLQRAPFELL